MDKLNNNILDFLYIDLNKHHEKLIKVKKQKLEVMDIIEELTPISNKHIINDLQQSYIFDLIDIDNMLKTINETKNKLKEMDKQLIEHQELKSKFKEK